MQQKLFDKNSLKKQLFSVWKSIQLFIIGAFQISPIFRVTHDRSQLVDFCRIFFDFLVILFKRCNNDYLCNKNLREHKNITLNNLCDKTGLSRSYLTKLENNHLTNCSVKTLEKISIALDTNIKNLFYSKLDIHYLKQKMNETIDEYGINSKEALEISQVIDLLVNIIMNQQNN